MGLVGQMLVQKVLENSNYSRQDVKCRGQKYMEDRHLPIVCFDNRLEPIPISMKNIGYRPIPIPIPILYKAF